MCLPKTQIKYISFQELFFFFFSRKPGGSYLRILLLHLNLIHVPRLGVSKVVRCIRFDFSCENIVNRQVLYGRNQNEFFFFDAKHYLLPKIVCQWMYGAFSVKVLKSLFLLIKALIFGFIQCLIDRILTIAHPQIME